MGKRKVILCTGKQAAQLIPLWVSRRGVGFMLDPASNKMLAVDPATDHSKFWSDLRECRNDGEAG